MSTTPAAPAGALRIGRVAGVPVYLDRTWLLLAAFIAWTGYRTGSVEGVGLGVAYAAWLVVAIFVAVLGHEVGHAVAARALGFHVHRIVATLWGGHTAYDATGATAGRTALVALSGPAVNAVLAAAGWAASLTLGYPAGAFAYSFAWLNGVLAVFNLLPGLPLDGGAAVQALVWGVTGRRDRGLLVAGWVGRVVAVVVGLVFVGGPLLRSGRVDLLDVAIGAVLTWVLWSGATAAVRRAGVERLLDTVRVGDAAEPAHVLPADTPFAVARELPGLVVCADEQGHPTLVLAAAPADVPGTTPVGALVQRIPTESVVEAEPTGAIGPVLRAMSATGVGLVVLTRAGAPWGVVTGRSVEAAAGRGHRRT
ncbi:site-2 protease family protein [Phycicoccus endophyticus]|uniref:Site-2 protease family protein n=1 Tax=Phycicoccus endophyticus TaxID=1690220 RepID=A0A7G9R4I5_9MICO|nr:site-2 protease family protein [Phycicoccus endophyticus]NHI18397.1 peptidase M50 [Phycicoccus endophyticus]QNN50510.1 site-2 protease family protein [Phycicoccus endophyticus]